MKIYSIKEIVEATNSFLKPKSENTVKDKNLTKQIKLTNENQVKTKNSKETNFKEDEKIKIKDTIKPIKIKLSPSNKKKEAPIINKIKFEPKVKDIIVNELYIFLKKKIRKSTLKIIIDEQIEIKNTEALRLGRQRAVVQVEGGGGAAEGDAAHQHEPQEPQRCVPRPEPEDATRAVPQLEADAHSAGLPRGLRESRHARGLVRGALVGQRDAAVAAFRREGEDYRARQGKEERVAGSIIVGALA